MTLVGLNTASDDSATPNTGHFDHREYSTTVVFLLGLALCNPALS